MFLIITGCSREDDSTIVPQTQVEEDANRNALGQVIAKAMSNEHVRDLIKNEALKQFDKDYDVLLYQIKDKQIANGVTFAQYLNSLERSKTSFTELLEKMPLATIYVADLPSFSAKSWNTKNQIPFVAVLNSKNSGNKIKAYNEQNSWVELDLNVDPPVDVVVIKENERITTDKSKSRGNFIFSKAGRSFYFLDNEFNNNGRTASRLIPERAIDPLILEAFNKVISCNTCNQRDYIYYGIFPPDGKKEGPLNVKFAEAITDFRLENEAAFNNMGGWAEGNFEINFQAFFPNKDTPYIKVVSASADDLLTYETRELKNNCISIWPFNPIYCTTSYYRVFTGVKTYSPASWPCVYEPFDMKQNGAEWRIRAFEYDPKTVKTTETTREVVIGTNFKAGVNGGEIVKFDLGFGTTRTETKKVTEKYETTLESNQLGEASVLWASPVITNITKLPFISTRVGVSSQLNTGSLVISFETVRISQ